MIEAQNGTPLKTQEHSGLEAVTATVALPPAAGKLILSGAMLKVQFCVAGCWTRVRGCPATTMVPVRDCCHVFSSTATLSEASPLPVSGEMEAQDRALEASQAQEESVASTVTLKDPPCAGTFRALGEIVYSQFVPVWFWSRLVMITLPVGLRLPRSSRARTSTRLSPVTRLVAVKLHCAEALKETQAPPRILYCTTSRSPSASDAVPLTSRLETS